jgi:hypothetical protein
MRVEPVSPFAALALHGLAHVPLTGIASLFDPAYVAWCAAEMPEHAREPLAADGPAIGAEADRTGVTMALQWLPRLHDSADAAARSANRDLDALDASDVADAVAARSLRVASPQAIEWLRADLALAADAFDAWHARREDALRRACADVAVALAVAPIALRPAVVRVAWSLGPRGRGFSDAVLVGAPAPWNAIDAATSAAIAIHEQAVVAAPGDHVTRERAAIASVSRALAGTALGDVHARWISGLVIP